MEKPNILYIFTDQQSAGAMSCTGNTNLSTPVMDNLARNGTRFTKTYCSYPLCTPSRASMFTGRMPHEVGVNDNGHSIDDEYLSDVLGHVLGKAGYDCAYGGKWHVPEWSIPEHHGFQNICNIDDINLAENCVSFLSEKRENPFFLVASFDNPHNICEHVMQEPLPWGSVGKPPVLDECPNLPANFQPSPYEASLIKRWREHGIEATEETFNNYSPNDWRRYRWVYNRLVEKVDSEIGKILSALKENNLEEDTVVIFSSDHGDHQGAHRLAQKWTFYEESMNVPFIISWKGVTNPGHIDSHQICNGPDLYATILDYANIPLPKDMKGLSVRKLAEGKEILNWRNHLVCETYFRSFQRSARMVRTEKYKYMIYQRGINREMLFDLDTDPGEMVNLAVEKRYAEVLQEHRDLLADWCKETNDNFGQHYAKPHLDYIVPESSL